VALEFARRVVDIPAHLTLPLVKRRGIQRALDDTLPLDSVGRVLSESGEHSWKPQIDDYAGKRVREGGPQAADAKKPEAIGGILYVSCTCRVLVCAHQQVGPVRNSTITSHATT
jgi:hypothetical protein